jgi:hypothetical protein
MKTSLTPFPFHEHGGTSDRQDAEMDAWAGGYLPTFVGGHIHCGEEKAMQHRLD